MIDRTHRYCLHALNGTLDQYYANKGKSHVKTRKTVDFGRFRKRGRTHAKKM